MTAGSGGTARAWYPWLVWSFGPAMFFYAFFQRVAPSVMIDQLMRDLDASGAVLGNLSAFYFYAYAGLQIPVGLMMDRYGPRRLLCFGALVCATGTFLFAVAGSLGPAYFGRLLVGIGASFGFVGALKLATNWLPDHRFALASGLLMMAGMAGGILGQAPLAAAVEWIGWRQALLASGAAGVLLGIATWLVVRDRPGAAAGAHGRVRFMDMARGLAIVLRTRQNWLVALTCASMTAPLLAFAGLWGVAWLMQVHGMSRADAAVTASLLLLGWAFGSPVAGAISDRVGRRKPPLVGAMVLGAVCLSVLLYLPGLGAGVMRLLFFVSGMCFGTMVIGFALARESNAPEIHGAAFGFLNGAVVGTGAVFQPLVGALLDWRWDGTTIGGAPVYDADAYRVAFGALLVFLGMGLIAGLSVREAAPRSPAAGGARTVGARD
ncbi:MAG: MFS transporter [Gammaproteobacteria bacterium]|nr:MFS transporter [Gammaproteobacteria bacterium]